ncbi:hypothetical protein [Pseudoalteromonas tetraodonis]|uniref:hypothetical protein n=1 Tax=Pseudoalteromonas tetraodonis TaxID=43659 RepID=UPI003A986844|tara:strand:- start:171 stop:392 length:222 start_codon:yes stop_codon:yes gene_type:complete
MEITVIKNNKLGGKEVFVDGIKVGALDVINWQKGYTFISMCPHEELTGEHYVLIGNMLNELNSKLTFLPESKD